LIGEKTKGKLLMIWRITFLICVEVFELHKTIWSPYWCKWLHNHPHARWSPNYLLKQEAFKKSNWNGQFTKNELYIIVSCLKIWQ
jgi:hypothetical protein